MTLTLARRWPILGAVLVAAAALVLGGCSGDESGRETASGSESRTTTTGTSEAPAGPEDVAIAFLDAFDADDAERALTNLTDEAIAAQWGSREEFRLLSRFLEATGGKALNTACEQQGESTSGTLVRCAYDHHAFRSDELGLGPYTGDYWDLTVQDGTITSATSHGADLTNGFSEEIWVPFARWVAAEHPDDIPVMYENGQSGWRITEESIPLWKQRLDEYAETNQQAQDP